MRPALIALFLCGVVLFTGCLGDGSNNPPTEPVSPTATPKTVSSKKNCCGKEICICTNCECCGACEAHIVTVKVVTTDIPKVMAKTKDCGCTYSKEKNIKGILGGPCTCDLCECGPSGLSVDIQRNK